MLLRMRTPYSNYIQPIKRSLKAQPPLENPIISIVFDISNGSQDMVDFMLKTTVHAHPPPCNIKQAIGRTLKVQPPLENPKISPIFRHF